MIVDKLLGDGIPQGKLYTVFARQGEGKSRLFPSFSPAHSAPYSYVEEQAEQAYKPIH
jgi:hypothetical protein